MRLGQVAISFAATRDCAGESSRRRPSRRWCGSRLGALSRAKLAFLRWLHFDAELPALLRRFPTLALAEDFENVQFRSFHFIYGLRSLEVSW